MAEAMRTRLSTSSPFRLVLAGVVNSRNAMWRKSVGNPRWDALRVAIGKAEEFLKSYPYAEDWRVIEWCVKHREETALLVPSNRPAVLDRLMGRTATLAP